MVLNGNEPVTPSKPLCGSSANGKRAAILLRGVSFRVGRVKREEKHANYSRFQLDVLDNYNAYLVQPLRDRGYEVDVFLAIYRQKGFTYEADWKPFEDQLQPKVVTLVDFEDVGAAHMNLISLAVFCTYCSALNKIYDFVVYTRYDLLFKTPVIEMPDLKVDRFNYAWKEVYGTWRKVAKKGEWESLSKAFKRTKTLVDGHVQ
ncbi:hypothetical protein CYMTET_13519 [Cymbomonas tetramitiformis]|uniref:Uncharacterized protein n=1 Tax=Cymbomonas tetramitiformis TaxID=36881 RepID=A0AAE0LBA8_9CHLO|nr:hypothetical protein CYMTET_13519 [Cymbomonas tetramitiformis]